MASTRDIEIHGDQEQSVTTDSRAAASTSTGPREEGGAAAHGMDGPAHSDIVAAITDGDFDRALTLCVREHGAVLGRLCVAMVGSQNEADDLLQDTLLTAHQSFGTWRGEGTIRGWLCGIARNKCLRHLEKQRRRQGKLRLVQPGERVDPEDVASLRQRASRARAALEQIKPTEREALLLRYVGQLSFSEVAMVCGMDEAAARKRVSRALLRLRSQLADEE